MSITVLSSMYKFTLYGTSVIILSPPPLHPHIHSIVKLSRKGASQTKREAFFKKMCFQIFLERGERSERVCGQCLVTLSLTINETLKWLSSLPILMQVILVVTV